MTPASTMKPTIEVAVKGAPSSQRPNTMPNSVSSAGVRMTSGSRNEIGPGAGGATSREQPERQ